jgi:WD40 repeat protein
VTQVDDGFRRRLVVLGCGRFGPDSGLSALDGIEQEIALVVDAFATLGFACPADHRILQLPAPAATTRMAELLRALGPEDVVAIYVTGHGEVVGGSLVIHAAGSRAGRKFGALTIDTLLAGLHEREAAERPRNILLILDVCHAGSAVEQAVHEVRAALPVWPEEPGTATGVILIAATRAGDAARVSAFARSWHTAVLAADIAGREQPYLGFRALADRVQANMGTQVVESVALYQRGDEVCLPNPRHHLAGVDPRLLAEVWEPLARALPERRGWTALPKPWFFTGRRRVNAHLARWLAGHEPDPVVVVTGAPGSGKSTILARLVVLTVPDLRREMGARGVVVDDESAPRAGFAFAATIVASRASTETIFRTVASVFGLRDRSDLQTLSDEEMSGPVPVVLVDALDEAEDPHDVVVEVLRPLAQAARVGALRLIVATREHPVGHDPDDPRARRGDLISPLLGAAEPIRVDTPQWLETGDIASYCERVLSVERNDAGRTNPYAAAARERRVLARAIEERARHSFLLAALVARRHTLDTSCVDPDDRSWREQFPERIGDAMRDELSALHGHREAARQLALLRPLALAEGVGLSRDVVDHADLWSMLATALDGDEFVVDDVDGLLEQRSATHLVSRLDADGHVVYRLHHEALAEALRPVGASELHAAHAAITDTLLSVVATARGWDLPYVRRALPFHARLGGRLADLAVEPEFLCRCDPHRLNAAFALSDMDLAAAPLLRAYVHRLHELDVPQRAFLLGVAARVADQAVLASGLLQLAGADVQVCATFVRPEPQRQVIADGRPVEALVATSDRAAAPLLFLGNGGYLEVREPDSGMLVESVLTAWTEITTLHAVSDSDGFPVVIAAGPGGAAIFDTTTRAQRASTEGAFQRGVAVSPPDSAELLIVGWTEERIDLWRPDRDPVPETLPIEWEPGAQPITSAAVLRSGDGGKLVAIAVGGEVLLWDAEEAGIVDLIRPSDTVNLQLTALCPDDGDDTLLLTTGLSYRTAAVWRPSTGTQDWTHGEVPVCAAGWTGGQDSFFALGYLDGSIRVWRPDSTDDLEDVGELSFTVQDIVVGPPGATEALIIAIDRIGVARSWRVADKLPGPGVSARQSHSIDAGRLRSGRPYLAIGGNRGAEVWRLDARAGSRTGLHDGDATRLLHISGADPLVVTAGDDGTLRIWHERDGRSAALDIPSGGINDMAQWREDEADIVAISAVNLLIEFDATTATRRRTHELQAGPTHLARVSTPGRTILAAAARTRLYFLDSTATEPWWFDLPLCYPGTWTERTTTARSITSLTWTENLTGGPELVVTTQGGMAVALRPGERHVDEFRGLADGMGIILVSHIFDGADGPCVVLGSRDGQLRVVDIASGRLVHDLTKDDARIAGAITVQTGPDRSVLVTTHCDRDVHQVTGLRIWDLEAGVQQHGVMRGASGDPYIGPPRPGPYSAGCALRRLPGRRRRRGDPAARRTLPGPPPASDRRKRPSSRRRDALHRGGRRLSRILGRPDVRMSPRIQDSYRRSLLVIAQADYLPESGLPPLSGVAGEVADISSAFATLGFPAGEHRVLVDEDAVTVQTELTAWLRERRADDAVAIYLTGHAEVLGDGPAARLYLHTRGSRQGRPAGTLRLGDLLDGLGEIEPEERPQNLLLVLDVCTAEAGIDEASAALTRWLPARFAEPGVSTGTHIVATARRDDRARIGAFASAWRAAIDAPDAAARSAPYLDLGALVDRVQDRLTHQVVVTRSTGVKGPNVCLPNPRHHLGGVQWREMDGWWDATARAARSGGDEAVMLFTGRRLVNRRISRRLTSPSEEPPVAIVTAAPGSGKSTVLARFVALTVPDFRARFVSATDDATAQPPEDFAFAAAIPAQGLSVGTVAMRVRDALGVPAGRQLDELGAVALPRTRSPVVLVDSVDEAESPVGLAREVLRPLAVSARRGHVRLLIGTRRRPTGHDSGNDGGTDLIALIGSAAPHEILDLDAEWLERGDIAEYATRILSADTNAIGKPNPYADNPWARRRLARAIEKQAKHAFFLAGLVAQAHTLDERVADPTSSSWVAEFPRSIGAAFEQELGRAYGPTRAASFRALLRPLAYGQGTGLSREHMDGSDLWAGLATDMCIALDASPDARFVAADVDELLHERIASHVVAGADDDGQMTFRFHHAALTDHFADRRERQLGHRTVVDLLLRPLDDPTADTAPWAAITAYTRRVLARHARLAGRLPDLCALPGFLVEGDPVRMHDELSRSTDGDDTVQALKRIFRGLLHRLPSMEPRQRAGVMAWECLGEPSLASLVPRLELWADDGLRRLAAVGQFEPARMTIALGETVPMALAAAPPAGHGRHEITDRPLAVAMGVEALLVDPASGESLCRIVDPEDPALILSLAFGWDAEGFAFLAVGGRRLSVWEPSSAVLMSTGPDEGDLIRSIVTGTSAGGRPFIAASSGTRVFATDPGTGDELWQRAAEGATLAVASTRSWATVLVVASWEEVVLLDPVSGALRATAPMTGVPLPAVVAVPRPGGDLVAVSGEHATVVWDPDAGEFHVVPGLPARKPALAVSPPGVVDPFVCVAQLNTTVLVWDPLARQSAQLLSGHHGVVEGMACGLDQEGRPLLVLGSEAGTHSQLSVWNLVTEKLVLRASSEGSISAVGVGRRADGTPYVATGSPRRTQVWDLPDRSSPISADVRGSTTAVAAVREPTGRLSVMATGSDVDVAVWTGSGERVLRGAGPDAVLAAGLDPHGVPILLTMADDFVVREWDPASARLRRMFELLDVDAVGGERHLVLGSCRDGRILVAGAAQSRVRVWDAEAQECLWESSPPEPGASTDSHITGLALGRLADGAPYVVFGTADGRVTRSFVDTSAFLVTAPDNGGVTDVVAGTSDMGRDFFAAGGRTGGPSVWEARTGRLLLDLDAGDGWVRHMTTARAADGRLVLAAVISTVEGFVLRAWSPDTGSTVAEEDLTDLDAGPVFLGSALTSSGAPMVIAVGGQDVVVSDRRGRVRTPLPARAHDAVVVGDTVVIAVRAGFLAAQLT